MLKMRTYHSCHLLNLMVMSAILLNVMLTSAQEPQEAIIGLISVYQAAGKDVEKEFDVYDEMLTQAEIQGNLNQVNSKF